MRYEQMTTAERAKLIHDLALEAMRFRMDDTRETLGPEFVEDRDIAFAMRFTRLCAPLHPLPEQKDIYK
jgi:hypothetical protein